jgi:hypothetical protein
MIASSCESLYVNVPPRHTLLVSERKMTSMEKVHELIEAPLSRDELALRYRALCDDPCYASVPGKIELDAWGRLVMSSSRLFD